jgi:hypothetical protein
MADDRIIEILAAAKKLAQEYRALTGEVAGYEAVRRRADGPWGQVSPGPGGTAGVASSRVTGGPYYPHAGPSLLVPVPVAS